MTRTTAIRLDGMLSGATANLDGIAHFMKNNMTPDEFQSYVKQIGEAMGAILKISLSLYELYPDIKPKELVPPMHS